MTDIYEFILHTLSVSLVAAFVLITKRIFRHNLPPLWQFIMWFPCAVIFIIPLNISTYLSLFTEMIKTFTSDAVTLTKPSFFFPVTSLSAPHSLADALFLLYFAGVLIFAVKYIISAVRIRLIIKSCPGATEENLQTIREVSQKYSLKICKAVTLAGIETPFICGIIKPVLILPDSKVDEKIILHELLHLKYKDVLWGLVIALFRCIHWCNPFLGYCLNEIGNDIEQLCDARTLERLSGEDRREYGSILLSMANEKYATFPGSTSIANGGRNIKRRIETIVNFKFFPQENAIISICIIALILVSLCIPEISTFAPDKFTRISDTSELNIAFSAARSYYCTTPKGAIDAYAYSIYQNNGIYKAISSPLSQHNDIKNTMEKSLRDKNTAYYEDELDGSPIYAKEPHIFNLEENIDGSFSAYIMLMMSHNNPEEKSEKKIAYQKIRVFEDNSRWVVVPEGDFQYVTTYKISELIYGSEVLPSYTYTAETELFTVNVKYQLCYYSDNEQQLSKPFLNATFDAVNVISFTECIYKGAESEKSEITQIGIATQSFNGEKDFEITAKPRSGNFTGSSSNGSTSASTTLNYDWDGSLCMSGGSHTTEYKKNKSYLPEHMAASLYVNGELYEELILEREG